MLIHICHPVVEGNDPDAVERAELLGPISMFEAGKFAYGYPERTAVVMDPSGFTPEWRAQKVLQGLAAEMREDFAGQQPYFDSLDSAERWIVERLVV